MSDLCRNLIPFPRRITQTGEPMKTPRSISLAFQGLAPDDEQAMRALAAIIMPSWLRQTGQVRFAVKVGLSRKNASLLRIPAHLRNEAYSLRIGRDILIEATHPAGLRHALQTLRQLLEDGGARGVLPRCQIVDWPRIASRGIHLDLARESEYRPAHIRQVVETIAYFRMNTLHLYLENKFVFPSAPEVAPPGVMTPRQARELVEYAKTFGITVIPQIPTMGHMEHFLHGPYAELREQPADSFNLCPSHERARPFLAGLIADIADAFRSPFLHVGYDESRSGICARCRARGTPQRILAEHLNWLDSEVRRHGARTMIYADKLLSPDSFPRADATNGGTPKEAAEVLRSVSRDIIITDWHYTAPFGGTLAALVREGFETHLASATNIYWHDSIPLHAGHHWIAETIEQAVAAGATGAFNCNWEIERGQFFDNFWFFQALAAERQWSDAPHDYAAFGPRFSRRFWGVEVDRYSELAGLAEVTPVRRREILFDAHILTPLPLQARFDYIESGRHIEAQAAALKREATRRSDTLRALDIPGLMIRYFGSRALGMAMLDKAFAAGSKAGAVQALESIKSVAVEVKARLERGYAIYGGAVKDRGRVQIHIDSITRMIAAIRKLKKKEFAGMTAGRLFLMDREQAQDSDPRGQLTAFEAAPLQPPGKEIKLLQPPAPSLQFTALPFIDEVRLADIRAVHGGRDGIVFMRVKLEKRAAGMGTLLYGADGPVKVWINGKEADCRPTASNPAVEDQYSCKAAWRKGANTILVAMATNNGQAWGLIMRTPQEAGS